MRNKKIKKVNKQNRNNKKKLLLQNIKIKRKNYIFII